MPYTEAEMLDDFREDVARLTAEVARLRAAIEKFVGDHTYIDGSPFFGLHDAIKQLQAALAGEVTK